MSTVKPSVRRNDFTRSGAQTAEAVTTNVPFRRRLTAALARRWWRVQRILDRRYGRLVLEELDGVPILVLPEVFNPVLLRTGTFMIRTLASLPLSPGAEVLDLGTGSGIGAIFAARRGARVTAVDINSEAVRCARINTLLNSYEETITVQGGDLFEPVAGRQFDLILFNPPFYRGRPKGKLDYAWRGDDLFERFAAGLDGALKPDGRCLLVLSSDGDGDELLAMVRADFAVETIRHSDLVNEIVTAYLVKRKA